MENITVTGDFGKKPNLEFTDALASPELEVEVLVPGDGPIVEAGDEIICNYLGQVWGGEVFDNSYDRGQALDFQIGVGMVIRGWDDGLVGQRVGSRILLSIPSDLGYGDFGVPQAGIKGGDTLVFVTDILGIKGQ
ncbi:FKBP-type peptidyl-prolyl cis-trans isomerase [Actinomycetaceae bacterium WB03_NA08]|uniref:Peptidyl-prolyl cis-trans isomerase n=1 Tax=Scrofimicrobium canadense TaxID=2652290 RepID=A0A6N7W1Z5_9ACTO|nr:FKBP-type peptidyl-prolyl cis-trans isomerase [Scrofimicrobium canadense]MSS83421.1 FKBP-type peptidyl-prolyl cis-trans isomerase [Scrofimicrobium canadense]